MSEARTRLDLIATRIAARAPRAHDDRPVIARRADPRRTPLSPQQAAAWRHQREHPDSTLNNLALRLTVPDGVDPVRLRAAVEALSTRHEILRTTYHGGGDDAVGEVHEDLAPEFEVVRARGATAGDRERFVREAVGVAARRAFALDRQAPLRVTVFDSADGPTELLLLFHHIVWDSVTFTVVSEELDRLYEDPRAALPPRSLHYGDFAAHLDDRRDLEHDLAYWRARLTPPPALPFRAHEPGRAFPLAGRRHDRALPAATVRRWSANAARHATSRFVAFTAETARAVGALLGIDDLTVGVSTSRREHPATAHALGDFSNLLTLRIALGDDPDAVVGAVEREFRHALAHARTHYETLGAHLPHLGNAGAPTAFDIIVIFVEGDLPGPSLGCARTTWERADNGGIQYPLVPLAIEVFLRERDPQIQFTYSPDLVDPEIVAAIADLLGTTAA